MTAKELRKCPKCRKNKLERLIGTGAGVIFKGSGFYETDYRGGSYASEAKKDADGGSDNSDGGGDGAAKPATESAPKSGSAPKSTPKESDSTD